MGCRATHSTFSAPCPPRGSNLRSMSRLVGSGVVMVLVASCAGAPEKKGFAPLLDPRDDVRALLVSAYAALQKHDTEKFTLLVAPDVMVFGLGPSDTFNYRDTAMESVRQAWADGRPDVKITPGRMPVGLAVGGQSGWVWDFPKVEMGTGVYLPRVTAHVVYDGESWRFDAIHISLGVADDKLYAPDALKKFVVPAELTGDRPKESEVLIEQTRHLLDDLPFKVAHTADGADVLLLGTDSGEVFEGGKTFKDLVKPRLAEIKKAVFEYKVEGPFRARLAPDGRTGWVAANVVLRVGSGRKTQTLPAFRTLWVFEKDHGEWNMVLEHQSVALRDEQRDEATADQLKTRDAREKQKAPVAPKVKEATDGGFGTFE